MFATTIGWTVSLLFSKKSIIGFMNHFYLHLTILNYKYTIFALQGTGFTPIELAERSSDGSIGSWMHKLLKDRLEDIAPREAVPPKPVHEVIKREQEVFSVGQTVYARYKKSDMWCEGIVDRIHFPVKHKIGDEDGLAAVSEALMYDVKFLDGTLDEKIISSHLRDAGSSFAVGDPVRFVTTRDVNGEPQSWESAIITRVHCDGTYGTNDIPCNDRGGVLIRHKNS